MLLPISTGWPWPWLSKRPRWEPGMQQAYHAISLGFYEGVLLRRVDPRGRSLGQFFAEEIASPLGLDFYIGLPEEIPVARLATIRRSSPARMILHPNRYVLAFLNPRTKLSDRQERRKLTRPAFVTHCLPCYTPRRIGIGGRTP
jgi:CubicO group peptidase (beta-lactamase class C family)